MALFAPFLLVPGLASLLLRELILVIAGVVGLSLLIAVTLTPMLAAIFLHNQTATDKASRFQRFFAQVTEWYGRVLEFMIKGRWKFFSLASLRTRGVVVLAFVALMAVGLALLPRVGTEFLPLMDDGRIRVEVHLPTGASVGRTDQIVRQVEDALAGDPLIESVFTLSGGRSFGLFTTEVAHEGELNVQLVEQRQRELSTAEYVQQVRRRLNSLETSDVSIRVRQASTRGIRTGAGGASDIALKIQGPELVTLFDVSQQAADLMRSMPEMADVSIALDMDRPEYQIHIDRTRAAALGLSVRGIAQSLQILVGGGIASRYKEQDEHYDIRVMMPEYALGSQHDVAHLLLDRPGGGHLRLYEVAEVLQAKGPVQIDRENQIAQVMVLANARGVSVGQALNRLEAELAALEIPAGYRFDFGGQAQLMLEMQRTMMLIVAFALFFAFVVLAVQFNQLKIPLLILITLPVCLAGMVFALWVADLALGATVIIGLLVVVAATVNDGVLLLNFAEEIRLQNRISSIEAVIESARIRLRPRVMTSVSVIAGLLPLALNLGEGGDMLQPMAVAAIGGLGVEILVALFLMPCLYSLFSRDQTATLKS